VLVRRIKTEIKIYKLDGMRSNFDNCTRMIRKSTQVGKSIIIERADSNNRSDPIKAKLKPRNSDACCIIRNFGLRANIYLIYDIIINKIPKIRKMTGEIS